jgi:hypothetical protein
MTEHASLGLFGLVRYIAENDAVAHNGAQLANARNLCSGHCIRRTAI